MNLWVLQHVCRESECGDEAQTGGVHMKRLALGLMSALHQSQGQGSLTRDVLVAGAPGCDQHIDFSQSDAGIVQGLLSGLAAQLSDRLPLNPMAGLHPAVLEGPSCWKTVFGLNGAGVDRFWDMHPRAYDAARFSDVEHEFGEIWCLGRGLCWWLFEP